MHTHALVALSAILLIGMGCQWIAWRVKLPAILFLLLSGILVGPVMNWVHPDQIFGDLLFPFISLAVAVILFEGSLTLKFQDIPGLETVIRNMITFGVIITWIITALATRLLLHFSWEVSLLFGNVLRRHWMPQYLHNFAALSLVCGVFALSEAQKAESGLLTVTLMGVWLANMKGFDLDEILDFKESLSVLLISMLFIILAARMNLSAFTELGWPALVVFAAIQLLARPLNVQISSFGSKLSTAERHLLAWIAPPGIVAAAISALFAMKLEAVGYQEASQMVPLTFMVIIGTVLLQSATAGPIAKWLKVADPEPKGFLIVGADILSQSIAEALQENSFRVLLTDQNWEHIKAAKMKNLPAYWGNPVSEHAERHLSLIGIGRLLALTSNRELNALAAKHFRMEFGANNIYAIRNHRTDNKTAEKKSLYKHGGQRLFQETATHEDLTDMLTNGAEIKTILLTDKFSYDDYLQQKGEIRAPLFAIDPEGHIHPLTSEYESAPKAGWKIIGLSINRSLTEAN